MTQVLLGDMGAGKSSLVLRFVKGQFHEHQESTIGAAFLTQTVCAEDRTIKFEIWDTAGQERYHSLAPMYYRGAAAAIIVYDIQSQSKLRSSEELGAGIAKARQRGAHHGARGNKCDMEEKREVQREEAEAYASQNGLFFMETSAKTAVNVTELFHEIAVKLPKAPALTNRAGCRPNEYESRAENEPMLLGTE